MYPLTFAAGWMVFRDCSFTPEKNVCSVKVIQGSPVHVCYETCDTDGCNGGPAVSAATHQHMMQWIGAGIYSVIITSKTISHIIC